MVETALSGYELLNSPVLNKGTARPRHRRPPRVRLAFAANCSEAGLFPGLANALMPRGP
jgi:hypothetical protein